VSEDRRPVLIGSGQLVQRDVAPAEAPSPLDLLERAARTAADVGGAGARALRQLDAVAVVDVVAWRPHNASRLLAERISAQPRREIISAVGGEMPLVLVNRLAREVAAGRVRLALVAGANTVRTLRRARNARIKLDWPRGGDGTPEEIGVTRAGNSPAEAEYGLGRPTEVYPIFENALRARRGRDLHTHRRHLGELMSRFSEVAAKNPYAWFPVARSALEIATPTPKNRMIAYPYTKYMNAVIETDQAAAVLLASADAARALGVPESRWIHWWGGASDQEAEWYPSERPDFGRCPALGRSVAGALDEAGVALADVSRFDFYSCFPVAVEMACEELGLSEDDPRGLTVTGGLPYAGGPGNNYTLHSLATTMDRLREAPGAVGLVTGNGWYLTKHSATVVASAPREADGWPRASAEAPAREVPPDTQSTRPVEGSGAVEAYTVLYDRAGAPVRGVVVGRTAEGRRFVANTPEERDLLEAFAAREQVGRQGRLRHRDGRNVFEPA
jgi:acetyl-CoA C-acetyltransferase